MDIPSSFQISSFLPYAGILLRAGNESELLQIFAKHTEVELCLRQGKKLTLESQSSFFTEQVRTYPYKELTRIFHRIVLNNQEELIFNIPKENSLTPLLATEMEHLSLALRLLEDKRRSQLAIEQRYREQFIQDLLFSRIHYEEELRNRSATYGWDLSGGVAVLVVDCCEEDRKKADRLFSLAKGRMKSLFPDALFSIGMRKAIFLIPLLPERRVKEDILLVGPTMLNELGEKTTLGVSDKHASFLEAGEAYQEANKAVEISKVFLRGQRLLFWNDLGAYKLLSDFSESKHAQRFMRDTLGKVLDYDKKHHSNLMDTLAALDRGNWNLKSTASLLYVHYNTIKYRYKKLEELLALDENDSEQRFNLSMALHIYQMRQIRTTPTLLKDDRPC